MKRKLLVLAVLIVILSIPTAYVVQASGRDDIAKLRQATAQYQRTPAARAAGYDLVPGLDYCFQNFVVGGRGYHYINLNLVDTTIDLLHPEAMVYAPDATGSIQLSAVGFIVPAGAWDAEYDEPPQVLGQNFHFYERSNAYVLHAWVWKNNPSAMFADWNPDVSCPAHVDWVPPVPGRWR